MYHRNISTLSMLTLCLGGGMGTKAHGELLYPQYQQALAAPITQNARLFNDLKTKPERLVNLALTQSQQVTRETISAFKENVDLLLNRQDMSPWYGELHRAKVNAMMLTGQFYLALETIEQLPRSEQSDFRLLSAVAHLEMGHENQALKKINDVPEGDFMSQQPQYLSFAQDMVVNYGISSRHVSFPKNGNSLLAQRLATFYQDGGFYDKAYQEYVRLLSLETDLNKQQAARVTLVDFAKTHDLVRFEVDMMEAFLQHQVELLTQLPSKKDMAIINEYSKKLTLYFSDGRNKRARTPEQIEPILASQKALAKWDDASHIAYLKNRTYLYRQSDDATFYSDVRQLAELTQDKALIVKAYDDNLPKEVRKDLLEGYFSIPGDKENDLYMAKAYVPFVEQCQDVTSPYLRLLKGHQWVQDKNYTQAHQCFEGVDFTKVTLPSQLEQSLKQEAHQIAYWVARDAHDNSTFLALAAKGNNSMRLDAAMEVVKNQPLSPEWEQDISQLIAPLHLSAEQQSLLNDTMIIRVRDAKETTLLLSLLKKEPEKHALELAWWAMAQDDSEEALKALMLRFGQSQPWDAFELTKAIRYLDGHLHQLSNIQRSQLESVSRDVPALHHMLRLQKEESALEQAFSSPADSMMVAVQKGLAQYQAFSQRLSPSLTEPNYTAQLWVQAVLEDKFSQYLQQILETAPEEAKGVLVQQITQHQQQQRVLLEQLMTLKLEGVEDERVWFAYQILGSVK